MQQAGLYGRKIKQKERITLLLTSVRSGLLSQHSGCRKELHNRVNRKQSLRCHETLKHIF